MRPRRTLARPKRSGGACSHDLRPRRAAAVMPLIQLSRRSPATTGSTAATTGRCWCSSHSLGQDHGDVGRADRRTCCRTSACFATTSRGHGASAAPAGDYTIEQLGHDVLALADALGIDRVRLLRPVARRDDRAVARRCTRPDRLTHLVLANTSPRVADPAAMEARRHDVLAGGMAAVADMVMGRFFSPASLAAESAGGGRRAAHAARDRSRRLRRLLRRDPRHGLRRRSSAAFACRRWSSAATSTSHAVARHGDVLAGAHSRRRRRAPAGGAPVESRGAALVLRRAARRSCSRAGEQRCEAGDAGPPRGARRRARRSGAHATTTVNPDFQDLITQYAWGASGRGPASTGARGGCWCWPSPRRWAAGRSSGCTCAPAWPRAGVVRRRRSADAGGDYAGVPAANTGFHIAAEEMRRDAPPNVADNE